MNTRTIKISVTTQDGELLDTITLEVPENTKAVAYYPIDTTWPANGKHECLTIGEPK